ncbi:MAG: hypothetical protein O3C57_03855 [Verrucomicrobia bacterium]|nr:hypothetical protein [Verrucomicrobiota bacterium]
MYQLHNAWTSLALYHAGMLAFLLFFRPVDLRRRACRGFRAVPGIPPAVACLVSGVLVYVLWPHFGISTRTLALTLTSYALTPSCLPVFVVYFGIVHGPLEELYWRTLTSHDLKPLSIRDFTFAGYHALVLYLFIPPAIVFLCVLVLTLISALWRHQARRYGGYAIPILSHALADLSILSSIYHLADF